MGIGNVGGSGPASHAPKPLASADIVPPRITAEADKIRQSINDFNLDQFSLKGINALKHINNRIDALSSGKMLAPNGSEALTPKQIKLVHKMQSALVKLLGKKLQTLQLTIK